MGERVSPQVLANDFSRQWDDLGEETLDAVARVGSSGRLILGPEVASFESAFARWWGVDHAVGVASGLDALEIGLRCAGIAVGDRVLTTPQTAFATTLAIVRAGGEPVWCDIDDSGGLDLDAAAAALRADSSIRAVLPVHLYGHALDPTGLRRLRDEFGVAVVEDCAQSAGAQRDGAPTGKVGSAAATSFYPTKNLGAMGDGGMLLTDSEAVAERARRLRDYGQAERYEHVELGLNSRLDETHAAILRSAHLPRIERWLRARRETGGRYDAALADSPLRPVHPTGGSSARHLYPVEVAGVGLADAVARLERRGVQVGRHYPVLCCDQPAAADLGRIIGALPVARRIASRELSLPIHPYLTDAEVEHVIEACAAL